MRSILSKISEQEQTDLLILPLIAVNTPTDSNFIFISNVVSQLLLRKYYITVVNVDKRMFKYFTYSTEK